MASNPFFPLDEPVRVVVPKWNTATDGEPCCECGRIPARSWRVVFPRVLIDVTLPDYQPISALAVECVTLAEATCGGVGFPYFADDVGSRQKWTLNKLVSVSPVTDGVPIIDFQTRVADACVSETVFSGRLIATSFDDHGLLVQTSGLSGDQMEFWARISPDGPQVSAYIRLQGTLVAGCCDHDVTMGHLVVAGP